MQDYMYSIILADLNLEGRAPKYQMRSPSNFLNNQIKPCPNLLISRDKQNSYIVLSSKNEDSVQYTKAHCSSEKF